jgi:hypothetical protein
MLLNIQNEINDLREKRKSLIYDFDKVHPENRKRYEEIQARLLELEIVNGI